MAKYTLERMNQIRGKQVFDELVVDGVAPFDTFIDKLEERYQSEVCKGKSVDGSRRLKNGYIASK